MAQDGNIPAIDEGEDWDVATIVRVVGHKFGIGEAFASDRTPEDILKEIGKRNLKVHYALERHLKAWQRKKKLIARHINPTDDTHEFVGVSDGYMDACSEMDTSRKDLIETVNKALSIDELGEAGRERH